MTAQRVLCLPTKWSGRAFQRGTDTVAHVAIAGDLKGTLFAVDHDGGLFRNRHARADGTGYLLHPGLGVRIGSGWNDVTGLAAVHAGARVILAGIDARGALVTADAPPIGRNEWATVAQPTAAASPSVSASGDVAMPRIHTIFPGTDGVLYIVTGDGALLRRQLVASDADPSRAATETLEASGWASSLALFTNGDGLFFDLTPNGTLRYQTTQGPGARPSSRSWIPLERAWSRYQSVFAAGPRGIYAVGAEGALELRPFSVTETGHVALRPRRPADVVGSGMSAWAGLASDIEGYCWPLSYAAGDTVDIKVGTRLSTPPDGLPKIVSAPVSYTTEVRRLRRMHDGKEGVYDDIKSLPALAGRTLEATTTPLPADWLSTGAGWTKGFSVTIPDVPPDDPNHWQSGVYAARCTDASGRDFYVSFIVRPTVPRNPFAVIANTNTWNAYNSWGGQGKYTHTYPVPETLPFHRPHPGLTPDVAAVAPGFAAYGPSVLTNSCHLLRAELWVLGWLEDLGPKYGYDIYTDQDLHQGIAGLGDGGATRYKGLILNTHPEYWTREMYDHVKAYRDQGGSIIYLGGNGLYEEVTITDDGHMGIFPRLDRSRLPKDCTNEQIRLYSLMRNPGVDRPEHALIGVGFQNCDQGGAIGQPYQLLQEPGAPGSNLVLDGVALHDGDVLGAMSIDPDPDPPPTAPAGSTPAPAAGPAPAGSSVVGTYHVDGWEVDQRGNGTPPQAYAASALLAIGSNESFSGEMICFDSDAGGVVFAAASLNFGGSLVVDANLQRIVQNALDLCLAR